MSWLFDCGIRILAVGLLPFAASADALTDRFVAEARAAYATAAYADYRKSVLDEPDYRDAAKRGLRADLGEGTVRWIDVEGTCNFRDLGGWTGLRTGLVYRGAEPNCHTNAETLARLKDSCHNLFLTEKGARTLSQDLGVRTDLDLRGEVESPTPDETPVPGAKLVRIACSSYTNFIRATDTAARLLRVFADAENYPIYFHCYGGADRTGSLAFLLEGLCGVSETDLSIDYELTSFSRIGVRPRCDGGYFFASMVREMKRRPGRTLREKIEHYVVHECGLTSDEVASIRKILCASRPDVLCIYYPEWHVYPEGERIFGKGRSEWDFVNTAVPRFPGHYQPIVLEAGNPDDSDPGDVAKEIDLAADAGIDVFLYDWYWADGHPIQHEALERGFMRAANRSRMKFALMWANHNRSNAFRPEPGKAAEKYWWKLEWTQEEFLAAIDYCIRTYFASPDYYLKDGRPFFSVYSAKRLIDRLGGAAKMRETLELAQRRMRAAGLPPIHFSAMVHHVGDLEPVREAGYDSASSYNVTPYDFDDNDVGRSVVKGTKQVLTHEEFALAHSQYNARIAKASRIPYIPVATRGWDCSPRCRTDEPFPWKTLVYPYYGIVGGLKPEIYREILSAVRRQAESDPLRPNAILINAWNEYTEGCYLMPDRKDGKAYLEATKGVMGWKTK